MLADFRSPKPSPGKTSITLVPMALMLLRTRSCDPWPRATTDTTEAMPMMMPSMVRKVRSLCAAMAERAMRSSSPAWFIQAVLARLGEGALFCPEAEASPVPVSRSAMISPSLISMIRLA